MGTKARLYINDGLKTEQFMICNDANFEYYSKAIIENKSVEKFNEWLNERIKKGSIIPKEEIKPYWHMNKNFIEIHHYNGVINCFDFCDIETKLGPKISAKIRL